MIKLTIFFLFFSLPAGAFIFINNGGYNKGARPVANAPMWAGRTVTYYVNTNQSIMGGSIAPELNTTQFQSAITSAVAAWNNVCGSNVQVVVAGTTNNVRASGDSVNTIMWDNRTTGEGNYAADTSTMAFATPNTVADTLSDCDVIVNGEGTGTFGIGGSATDIDLIGVLVHEIGHCLGLDHTVEPPTYTSNNSILLNAVMNFAISAGDTSKRLLGQDEIDSMECVYPSTEGHSARGGSFCTSYHGTNGGAALSGTVSGGPDSTRICGDGQSTSVTKSTSSGGGCASKALAADGSDQDGRFDFIWAFLFPIIVLSLLRKKISAFFLSVLFLIFMNNTAHAFVAVEVSYTMTRADPAVIKSASQLTSAEGTYSSISSKPKTPFTKFNDLYAALSYADSNSSSWGLYYKKSLTEEAEYVGSNSSSQFAIRKNTEVNGWLVGLVRKYYLFSSSSSSLGFFFEAQVSGGKAMFNQKIVDLTSTVHSIEGSAFVLETNAYLGMQIPLWGSLDGLVKAGYGRMHTNYFTVNSVSGSRYGTIKAGDRMAIRSGSDLRLIRDGFSIQAGLTYDFGSSHLGDY